MRVDLSVAGLLALLALAVPAQGAGGRQVLYVSHYSSGDIRAYSVDSVTGKLSPFAGAPFSSAPNATGLRATAGGRTLFLSHAPTLGSPGPAHISALRVDQSTGALAPAPGSPIPLELKTGQSLDVGAIAPAASSSGKFVYAAVLPLSGEGQLFGVSADASSGELRHIAGTPLVFTDTVNGAAFGPNEKVLYVPWINDSVGYSQAGRINVYSIAADGALTLVRTVSTGGWSPGLVYVSPSGSYVLVPQRMDASVSGPVSLATFTIDPATGVLSASPASVIPAGVPGAMRLMSVAFHPSGKFAYLTVNDRSTPLPVISRVAAFKIDVNTGVATPVAGTPVDTNGTGARTSRVDPTGKFLYVSNGNSSTIQAYGIDQATGALTPVPGAPFTAGANVGELEFEGSGKFLYSLDSNAYTLSTFAVDQTTGALTFIRATPTGDQPSSMELVELPQ